MRKIGKLDPEMSIDAVMRAWPETIGLLLKHQMMCVGCPIGIFHTTSDACREHDIDEQAFVTELIAVIGGT